MCHKHTHVYILIRESPYLNRRAPPGTTLLQNIWRSSLQAFSRVGRSSTFSDSCACLQTPCNKVIDGELASQPSRVGFKR
jgi:hypothetical protein